MPDVCPECGLETTARTMPPALPLSARRLIPLLITILAALTVAWMSFRSVTTFPGPTGPSTINPARAIGDGYTRADVEAIHDGVADGRLSSDLAASLREQARLNPDGMLYARFMPPTGQVTDTTTFGWPRPWITAQSHTQYEDAPHRLRPRPMQWGEWRPMTWRNGSSFRAPGPNAPVTASTSARYLHPRGIALSLLIIVVIVLTARTIACVARHPLSPRATAAVVLLALGVVTIAACARIERSSTVTLRPIQSNQGLWYPFPLTPSASIGLTVGEIRPDDPRMDEIVAGAILASVDVPPNPDDVLACEPALTMNPMTTSFMTAGWPLPFVHMTRYAAPPTTVVVEYAGIVALRSDSRYVGVDVESIALILLGLVTIWLGARAAGWLIVWRRTRARVRRRACVGCAYPLPAMSPPTP